MRIGIVPAVNPAQGGIYQYSISMLRALYGWRGEEQEDEFIVFASETPDPILIDRPGWETEPSMQAPPPPASDGILERLRGVVGEGPHREAWRWMRRCLEGSRQRDLDKVQCRPDLKRRLQGCGVDWMLYAWPNTFSFEAEMPYVMAIHDLQHRLQPEFPEVAANGLWESREYMF